MKALSKAFRSCLAVSALMGSIGMFIVSGPVQAASKHTFTVAYITPSLAVPFWKWTYDGVVEGAKAVGAKVISYDSHNDGSTQLANAQNAITKHVDAIVISPTDTSTTPAVLRVAARAHIPVVIAFIGTSSGKYLSYVTSTDYGGAKQACSYLTKKMKERNWSGQGIGEVTIPLTRTNGKERAKGCADAVKSAGDSIVGQLQFQTDTIAEDRGLVQNIFTAHPNIKGFFCQSDDCTLAAVRVFQQKGALNKSLVLVGFDASPGTVDCIRHGLVLGSSVQQPVTVGKRSFEIAYKFVTKGISPKKQDQQVKTILVTKDNVNHVAQELIGTAYPESATRGASCPAGQ